MVRQIYLIATGIVFTISIWMIFLWAPTEINQGQVQRILYLHVPFAWASMVAIIAIAFTSFLFLLTKNDRWDNLSQSLAEVGLVSAVVMLFSLVLFFIYCAYLLFRNYFPPGNARNRIAAIIALIGAIDSPIIYYAAQIWEQNHPKAVVGPLASEESSLNGEMVITLLFCVLTVTLLFVGVVWTQYQTNKLLWSKNA